MKLMPQRLRELNEPDGNNRITSASGLVKIKNHFYVIADDQLTLARFHIQNLSPIELTPLLLGNLPFDFKERKKVKPDWESLCKVSFQDLNGLLAMPSGSTENREMGIFIKIIDDTISSDLPMKIDLSEIFSVLRLKFPDLNIEGSVVFNDRLKLFQRGNGVGGVNAIIDIDLKGFMNDVQQGQIIGADHISQIKFIELGELNGVRLGFTDTCTIDDKLWFLAAAEDSKSTYHDGLFCGSILGCLNSAGDILARYEIDCLAKPEGLWIESEKNSLMVYFVTDADSPEICSALYSVRLKM